MNIKFNQNEEGIIETKVVTSGEERDFNYIDFIEELYAGSHLEDFIFENEVSQDMKNRIISMIDGIKQIVEANNKDGSETEQASEEIYNMEGKN